MNNNDDVVDFSSEITINVKSGSPLDDKMSKAYGTGEEFDMSDFGFSGKYIIVYSYLSEYPLILVNEYRLVLVRNAYTEES